MKLIECYIENFGRLKDEKISFSEGLNSIKRDNGWGKTTLATFIKVMLFGMSDTKKANLDENDRKHYLPWDGSAARGTLTFEADGKVYRIERGFAAKPADDTFTLYDVATGKATDAFSESLGEELFGIDADGFERTVFLSERALTPKSENKSVSAKLSDLVGCDGDIGVMDDAMKALEERRKFYYKKGGSGEIANVKNKISEVTRRLEHLCDVEKAIDGLEARRTELNLTLAGLEKQKSALAKERECAALSEAKAELTRRYAEIKAELLSLEEKKKELLGFFGDRVPTFNEISDNAMKLTEAVSIEKKLSAEQESRELTELKSYFDGKTDEKEIETLKRAIYEEKSRRARLSSPESERLKARFSKRVPTHGEVDAAIALLTDAKSKKAGVKLPLLIAGAVLAAAGLCLGFLVNFALLAVSAIGIIATVLAFLCKGKAADNSAKIDALYLSVSGSHAPSEEKLLADLFDIKSCIDKAAELERIMRQNDAEAFIYGFAAKFPTASSDVTATAEEIAEKHARYTTLKAAEEYRLAEKSRELARATELRDGANAFVARFHTVTDKPFDEIRERLNELERVTRAISDKEREALRFAEQYGGAENAAKTRPLSEIDRDISEIEESFKPIRQELAVNERSSLEYSRELEERDELSIRLAELTELYEKHNENYSVILRTKEYLERAKDSITAKYLGKTKAGFERYTALIGGGTDECFEMSTDFGVAKFEGASPRSTEAYSRGTRDLYNLAARLALVDSLYEGESPFVILDDPFTAFDDEKTEAALKLLEKLGEGKQIIYFTCSKSREA